MRSFKHKHGTPNPIIQQEEKSILLSVDQALYSSLNSQIIGRNGEVPLIGFLNRYLPPTLRATTGHFITPSGKISPQMDIMILDSRYPLLSENKDRSVLAMLHALVWCVEVKTNLKSADVRKAWSDSVQIMQLAQEVEGYGECDSFSSIGTNLMAYRCGHTLNTLKKAYEKVGTPLAAALDAYILRFPEKKQPKKGEVGGLLHFEPPHSESNPGPIDGFWPCFSVSHTPLSDFYYRMVQNCYYTLGQRNYSFTEIGKHFIAYMSWSNTSWDIIEQDQ